MRMPTKSFSGFLRLLTSGNVQKVTYLAQFYFRDPTGTDKKIAYDLFPAALAGARHTDSTKPRPKLDDGIVDALTADTPSTGLKWEEDAPDPQMLETDVATVTKDSDATVAELLGDPDFIKEKYIVVMDPPKVGGLTTAEYLTEQRAEEEAECAPVDACEDGCWQDELAKVYPEYLQKAVAFALGMNTLSVGDLRKLPTSTETGTAAFLRQCLGAANGCADRIQFSRSDDFRRLLSSAIDESDVFKGMGLFDFADRMSVTHDKIEYKDPINHFLHLCCRLSLDWY